MRNIIIFICAVILPFVSVNANDAELYDPTPSADSAFVRIIIGSHVESGISASISGVEFGDVSYPLISNYRVIKAGDHKVSIGGLEGLIALDAGSYATIAFTSDGKIKLIKDDLLQNPSKARVYLYNFSDADSATVFAPEHNTAILDNVPLNSGSSVEVNALKLKAQVKAGDDVAKEFSDVQLKRRIGTSFVITGSKGSYKAIMVENEVER